MRLNLLSEDKSVSAEFVPCIDYTLTEKSGENISVIWFLEQLVPMASSLPHLCHASIVQMYSPGGASVDPYLTQGSRQVCPHHGITINSAVLAGLTDELNYYRFLVLSLTVWLIL